MNIPYWLLRLLPMWDYICSRCRREVEKHSHQCPYCGEHYGVPVRVPPKVLKDKKVLEDYVHKHIFPKIASWQRDYLAQFFTELFSDGFESGDLSAWTGTSIKADTGSSVTVVTDQKHHGTYSCKSIAGAAGAWAEVYKDPLSSSLSTGYFRTYVKFDNLPVSGNKVYFHVTELTPTIKVGVIVRNSAGQLQWGLWYYNNAQLEGYVDAAISSGVWYCVEVKHVQGNPTGQASLYVNGSELIAQTGLDVNNAMTDLWEGIYDAVGEAFTIYFDCVVVADIGPIGQETGVTAPKGTIAIHAKQGGII